MNSKKTAAVRGRPRDFDIDKALDRERRRHEEQKQRYPRAMEQRGTRFPQLFS